jgi:hypothetical protein
VPEETAAYPWPSYYGHFDFFEGRMRSHSRIASIMGSGDGVYDLGLKKGGALRVFICECYSFGVAEYTEVVAKLGQLDAIIINSAWCGYTPDAKRMCRTDKVGLFKIKDFMAALNKPDLSSYLNATEKEAFAKKGWP